MPYGAFTDKAHPPSPDEILEVVGAARPLWERLAGLAQRLKAQSDLKMYGPSYGWMVCYRRAGRLLFSLYPARDALTAQIVLHQNQVGAAADIALQPGTRAVMEAARQYPEGRWLFIPVATAAAADVERLAELKSAVKKERHPS